MNNFHRKISINEASENELFEIPRIRPWIKVILIYRKKGLQITKDYLETIPYFPLDIIEYFDFGIPPISRSHIDTTFIRNRDDRSLRCDQFSSNRYSDRDQSHIHSSKFKHYAQREMDARYMLCNPHEHHMNRSSDRDQFRSVRCDHYETHMGEFCNLDRFSCTPYNANSNRRIGFSGREHNNLRERDLNDRYPISPEGYSELIKITDNLIWYGLLDWSELHRKFLEFCRHHNIIDDKEIIHYLQLLLRGEFYSYLEESYGRRQSLRDIESATLGLAHFLKECEQKPSESIRMFSERIRSIKSPFSNQPSDWLYCLRYEDLTVYTFIRGLTDKDVSAALVHHNLINLEDATIECYMLTECLRQNRNDRLGGSSSLDNRNSPAQCNMFVDTPHQIQRMSSRGIPNNIVEQDIAISHEIKIISKVNINYVSKPRDESKTVVVTNPHEILNKIVFNEDRSDLFKSLDVNIGVSNHKENKSTLCNDIKIQCSDNNSHPILLDLVSVSETDKQDDIDCSEMHIECTSNDTLLLTICNSHQDALNNSIKDWIVFCKMSLSAASSFNGQTSPLYMSNRTWDRGKKCPLLESCRV